MAHINFDENWHWWEVLPCLVITNHMGPCALCKKSTVYVDISFEAHICYPDCREQMWLDYERACQKSDDAFWDVEGINYGI